jgi:hypothetical protein
MQRVSVLVAAGVVALGQSIAIQDAAAADAFAVHGINGTDLGFDEALTVDIAVDVPDTDEDPCLAGVQFGDVLGPVADLPAGAYGVEIRLPDSPEECGGTLVVGTTVSLSLVETALIVAHLDANGVPVVSKFTVNTAALDENQARLSAIHAAQAPAVDIEVVDPHTNEAVATWFDREKGTQTFPLEVGEGAYRVRVSPSDPLSTETQPPVAREDLEAAGGMVGVGVIVGSVGNDTIETLVVAIDPVE